MVASHRQKVFFMALALTMTALIVDRLFVLPKGAGAKDSLGPEDGGLVVSIPDLPESEADSAGLAGRLESAYPDTQGTEDLGRDAFAFSSPWRTAPGSQDFGGPGGSIGEFIKRHRLTAVAVDGQTTRALIDDRPMVIGQELDRFTLVEIQEDRVVFAADQRQFVLSLASDP